MHQSNNKCWRLDGKRAIVTGATKVIGRAIAFELAALGAEVLIVARNAEEVENLISEQRAEGSAEMKRGAKPNTRNFGFNGKAK